MKTFIKKLFYPTTIAGKLILLVYFLSLTGLMIYGAINKSIASIVVLPFFIFALAKVILNFKNKDTKISSESIKKNFKIFLNGLKATIFVFAKVIQFLSVIIVVYLLYYLVTDNVAYKKLPSLINRIESKHNVNVEVDGMMKDDAMVSYYDFIRYGNRGKNDATDNDAHYEKRFILSSSWKNRF